LVSEKTRCGHKAVTILVVDDDKGTLNALNGALRSAGHHIVTAENGRCALDKILASNGNDPSVDLLVTDLRMPGMTGLELIWEARKNRPRLPAILMTGYGDDSIRWQSMELSSCWYAEKPLKAESLLTKIEDLRIFKDASGGE
jgi:DNA-binding NtrC family response regulator